MTNPSGMSTAFRDAVFAELSAWRFHDTALEMGLFRTVEEETKSLNRCRMLRDKCEAEYLREQVAAGRWNKLAGQP